MKISEDGVRLICSFEGYHKKLSNGDCTAYQTYLGNGKYDIPTIGYGCTSGVKMGDVWTEEKARDELRKELAKHESYVTQYVTVPIGQNEFDALVSFSYNCGPANLKKLVSRLNKGDRTGTAKAFLLYVKAQGQTLPGLVSRRTRESALFQKPAQQPEEPFMPQTVTASAEPAKPATVATAAGAAAVVATQTIPGLPVPSVPPEITDSLTNVSAWKGIGEQLWTLKEWAASQPMLAGALSLSIGGFWLWSKKKAAP